MPKSTTNTGAQIALCSKLELRATPPPTACSQHDQIWAYSTVKPYRDSYNKHSSQTDSRRCIAWARHEGGHTQTHTHQHIRTHTHADTDTHHSPAHPTDSHSPFLQFIPLLPTTTPTPAPLVMYAHSSVGASFYSNTQTVCKTKGLYPHKRDVKSGKS